MKYRDDRERGTHSLYNPTTQIQTRANQITERHDTDVNSLAEYLPLIGKA